MTQKHRHWGDFVADCASRFGELAVGIDPVWEDIPLCFGNNHASKWLPDYVEFVLEVVSEAVGIVKFQSAFYEAWGTEGIATLSRAIAQARMYGLGVILDAKRGDIGSTATAYARAYLVPAEAGSTSDLEVDCITVNPFLGPDSLEPFVECARRFGKGLFVLAKTSNPGAGWLQDQRVQGEIVADRTAQLISRWAQETRGQQGLSSVGAVVGATYPEDGRRLRALMPDSIFLAPGLGPQGGDPSAVRALRRPDGSGVIAAMSRGITKVDDRSLSLDDYKNLIIKRMSHYKEILRS